jgi:hypothetical protein
MQEVKGDIWELSKYHGICITTNGILKKDNRAVMGAGIAKAARDRFLGLDVDLGKTILSTGNHVYYLGTYIDKNDPYYNTGYVGAVEYWKVISFPTKQHWMEDSKLDLIKQSITELTLLAHLIDEKIYLPRPGTSNGHLKWEDVKPILEVLDDRFIVVDREY